MPDPHPISEALREAACMVRQFKESDESGTAPDVRDFLKNQADSIDFIPSHLVDNMSFLGPQQDMDYMRHFAVSHYVNASLSEVSEYLMGDDKSLLEDEQLERLAKALEEQADHFQNIFDKQGEVFEDEVRSILLHTIVPETQTLINAHTDTDTDELAILKMQIGSITEAGIIEPHLLEGIIGAFNYDTPLINSQINRDIEEITHGLQALPEIEIERLKEMLDQLTRDQALPELAEQADALSKLLEESIESSRVIADLYKAVYEFVDSVEKASAAPDKQKPFQDAAKEMLALIKEAEGFGEISASNFQKGISYAPCR